MTVTNSWMWYPGTTWPGFNATNQNNAGTSGNGLTVAPGSMTDIAWNDANADGVISDSDTDDGTAANGDRVTVNGVDHTPKEMAAYNNSTIVANGITYTLRLGVVVFEDGTFGVRMLDGEFPAGLAPHDITSIQLGTFDGAEYSYIYPSMVDDRFVCFAAGTPIDTPEGPRPVEALGPGDSVMTLDNGAMRVLWAGRRTVAGTGAMAPVLIGAYALGNSQAIRVSPQHRILIGGWRAELHFDRPEVLIAARHLVGTPGVVSAPCAAVTYVHLLLEGHQILRSAGLFSESLLPALVREEWFGTAEREAVLKVCPYPERVRAARICVTGNEARVLRAA